MKKIPRLKVLLPVMLTLVMTGVMVVVGSRAGATRLGMAQTQEQKRAQTRAQRRRQTGATRTQPSVLDQDAAQKVAGKEEENDDADLPGFAVGRIDKEEYLNQRGEHIRLLRGFQSGEPVDIRKRVAALQQMEALIARQPTINTTSWTPVGPAPIPNGQTQGSSLPVSGRVTAIAVHPTNPNTVYVGTANAGVYRSLDGGTTWTAIFDTAQTLAIGALTIDPVTTTTLWVGTGESEAGSPDCYAGVGVYRIKNADTSAVLEGPYETRTGSAATTHAFLNTSISKIVIDPTNNNNMWVGNSAGSGGYSHDQPPHQSAAGGFLGLYFSSNAQAATPTWIRLDSLPGGGAAATTDIVIEPGNSNNLVVAVADDFAFTNSGIYRSTNATLGGTSTWTRTFDLTGDSLNIRLAIHKVGTTVTVLAGTAETAVGCDGQPQNGVLRRSVNGGASWSSPITSAGGFCGGQCFYDIAVAVDPTNVNNIYLGGAASGACSRILTRATNGTSFADSAPGLHSDTHAIAVAPSNPSIIYTGNDGGIFKSTNAGVSWTSLNNTGISATQFQSLATHPRDREFMLGGTQDNGTNFKQANGTWARADFGDGGFALIDQNAVNTTNVTMYHTYFNQVGSLLGLARVMNTSCATEGQWVFRGSGTPNTTLGCEGVPLSANNGLNVNDSAVLFYAPMALGPGNPNTLYFGTDRLYRSANRGDTMTLVSQQLGNGVPVTAIGIAPSNDNVRLVGLQNGTIFLTITGSSFMADADPGGVIPAVFIARIVIDPNNANIAYVAVGGFGLTAGQHIWKTSNLLSGTPTWTASGTGIPDIPVNAFALDRTNSSALFAGTDIGVYRSTNGGASWTPYSTGLPRAPVFDMAFQEQLNNPGAPRILRIATHGRGIWEIQTGACPALTLAPSNTTLPAGTVGTAYSQTFTQTGGTGTITWSNPVGSLPGGLTLNSTTGVLSGTPTASGSFNFTIRATDQNTCFGELQYSLTINTAVSCPTATNINPTSGLVGSMVTITGTNFTGVTGVKFSNSVTATFTVVNATTITATVPNGATTGPLTISKAGCTDVQTASFTVTTPPACPTVSNINPTSGLVGSTVTITGANFTSVTAVKFSNSVTATFTVVNDTQLSTTVPSGAVSGPITISKTGCADVQTASFTVTTPPACPTVSNLNPTSGLVGSTVTITGTNFTGVTGVKFSNNVTATFTVVNATTITATVPSGAATGPLTISKAGCTDVQTASFTVTTPPACPTVSNINPTSGLVGSTVTITGANFTSVTAVKFSNSVTANFTVINDSQLTTTVPSGAVSGPLTISKTGCADVQTASFTVTSGNPCTPTPITLGQTVNGQLSVGDCALSDGSLVDLYSFSASAGQQISISLTATAFDTYLYLLNPSNNSIAENNNGGGGTNARIPAGSGFITLPITGTYTIYANSLLAGQIGSYSLTLTGGGIGNGLMYYPLPTPVRLLDTRPGQSACDAPGTAIQGQVPRTEQARVICSGVTIPANAQAITGNFTVVNQLNNFGYGTLYPAGGNTPNTANLNYTPFGVAGNSFVTGLNASGQFNIFAFSTVHVVIDVTGYYAPPGAGGLYYHALPQPVRLLETRPGQQGCDTPGAPIQGQVPRIEQARVTCGGVTIPTAAQAITGNFTVVNQLNNFGYGTLYPAGGNAPNTANLNYTPFGVAFNSFITGLNANGQFNIFSFSTTDAIIDVDGYFSFAAVDANGTGLLYTPLASPIRLLETRPGQQGCDTPGVPLTGQVPRTEQARVTCGGVTVPSNAAAITGIFTVVNQLNNFGYGNIYPTGGGVPNTANLNYVPAGVAFNSFITGLNGSGQFNIFTFSTVHVIVDVAGFFAP